MNTNLIDKEGEIQKGVCFKLPTYQKSPAITTLCLGIFQVHGPTAGGSKIQSLDQQPETHLTTSQKSKLPVGPHQTLDLLAL